MTYSEELACNQIDWLFRVIGLLPCLATEPNKTSSVSEQVINKVSPSDALVARKVAVACINLSSIQHPSAVAGSHEAA